LYNILIVHDFPVISKHGWDLVSINTWCDMNVIALYIEQCGYYLIVTCCNRTCFLLCTHSQKDQWL